MQFLFFYVGAICVQQYICLWQGIIDEGGVTSARYHKKYRVIDVITVNC